MLKEINIDLSKLMSKEAAARLRESGLHKIAAAMLRQEGVKVGEEITMADVVQHIGTKLRQKNAEWSRVHQGLQALKNIK